MGLRGCVQCHFEKSRCNREDEAIPEGLDCLAEFILSAAEGLARTNIKLLTHPLRVIMPLRPNLPHRSDAR